MAYSIPLSKICAIACSLESDEEKCRSDEGRCINQMSNFATVEAQTRFIEPRCRTKIDTFEIGGDELKVYYTVCYGRPKAERSKPQGTKRPT